MSESIKGSKSFLYSIEEVPGVENSKDSMQHLSIQEIAGKRGAADVMIHGVTTVSTAHIIEAGSSRKKIVSAGSNAKQGWFIKMTSGNSINEEIAIVKVIDANSFVISALFDIALTDTFDILRSVTPSYTASGDLNVVVAGSSPVQFVRNGVDTEVLENTTTPANNRALPSKMFIQKDGVTLPVNKDTGVPANTVAIPVEIVSASGTNINITAGDINIQTTSEGASFDSMRIGDGSGNYAGITVADELQVHDNVAITELQVIGTNTLNTVTAAQDINAKTPALGQALSAASTPVVLPAAQVTALTPPAAITGFALETTQQTGNSSLGSIDTKLSSQATAANQTTANGSLGSIDTKLTSQATALNQATTNTKLDTLIAKDYSTATKQDAQSVLLGAVNETAPATDTASSGHSGRLQRIAQRLTSLIALFPSSIGQKVAADSLSVVLASNQGAVPTAQAALTSLHAQSLVISNTVAVVLTAPAGAKKVKVYAADANSVNLRLTADGVTAATSTVGFPLTAQREMDFESCGSISVIAETTATNQGLFVHWSY